MNDAPSKVIRLTAWNPTRMTENSKSLDSIRNTYSYLHTTCIKHSVSSVTSDGTMRARLTAAIKSLETFQHMFLMHLSIDFFRIMDSLNASFQDPKKSLSEMVSMCNKTMQALEKSRTDEHWNAFYKITLKHVEIIDCVQCPSASNVTRRRPRRNCREIQNYFQIDGIDTCNSVDHIRAIYNNNNVRVKVYCNGKLQQCEMQGMLNVALNLIVTKTF